jgi:hypothetical protein
MAGLDIDDWSYSNLANFFCTEVEEDRLTWSHQIQAYFENYCATFDDLDWAGYGYVAGFFLFLGISCVEIVLTGIILGGKRLISKSWLIGVTSLGALTNISVITFWVILSEAWYTADCEQNIMTDYTELCPGTGFTLALSSAGL